MNIISTFFNTAQRMGDRPCAHFKRGGLWHPVSWLEMADDVRKTALGLARLGGGAGNCVAICSQSRIEWTIADCAIMAFGGITVPIYPSLTPERIAAILADARPKFIIVEDARINARVAAAMDICGHKTPSIISFEDGVALNFSSLMGRTHFKTSPAAISAFWLRLRQISQKILQRSLGYASGFFAHLPRLAQKPEISLRGGFEMSSGASQTDLSAIDQIANSLPPSQVATLVYTSGTMGEQKGVVITHGNILAEVEAVRKVFDFAPDEIGLVCLPLAHVLGRLMQFYQLAQGCQAAYAEGMEKLASNFVEIRPNFVCGVPRMLEKMCEAITSRVETGTFLTKKIFKWAVNSRSGTSKNVIPTKVGIQKTAKTLDSGFRRNDEYEVFRGARSLLTDILVFRRIRAKLGGRLKVFISGGAPLKQDIAEFFHAAGILVLEGYGLTETFAAATVNRPWDFRFGTVGKPVDGVELKLADDGEVLIRGPTVFGEYKNLASQTREAFDEGGWFRTGDIGEISGDGFLKITGRKKDIIVTAGGKNIAPQPIEAMMSSSPLISHFMAYGDGRKYLSALVTVNSEAAFQYLRQAGLNPADSGPIARHPAIRQAIEAHIETQNKKLPSFEQIKKFTILDGDFSIETGELTPTLKIRRGFTSEKYRDVLEGLY